MSLRRLTQGAILTASGRVPKIGITPIGFVGECVEVSAIAGSLASNAAFGFASSSGEF